MNVTRQIFLGSVMYLAFIIAAIADNGSQLLSVHGKIAFDHGKPVISFTVKNLADKPVTIWDSSLPWNAVWFTHLFIDHGRPIIILSPAIVDKFPPPSGPTLKVGQELSGKLPLSEYVNNVETLNHDRDVVVFWFCSVDNVDIRSLGNYGGWLLIHRNSVGKAK